MDQVYIRMASVDQDEAFLKAMGREIKPQEEEPGPILCARCEKWNEAGVEFCQACNFPLSEKGMLKREQEREAERRSLERGRERRCARYFGSRRLPKAWRLASISTKLTAYPSFR